jgi:hypothetical protein
MAAAGGVEDAHNWLAEEGELHGQAGEDVVCVAHLGVAVGPVGSNGPVVCLLQHAIGRFGGENVALAPTVYQHPLDVDFGFAIEVALHLGEAALVLTKQEDHHQTVTALKVGLIE